MRGSQMRRPLLFIRKSTGERLIPREIDAELCDLIGVKQHHEFYGGNIVPWYNALVLLVDKDMDFIIKVVRDRIDDEFLLNDYMKIINYIKENFTWEIEAL